MVTQVTSKTFPRYLGGTHYIMGILVTSKTLLRYLGGTHYIMGILVTSKMLLRYLGGTDYVMVTQVTSKTLPRYLGSTHCRGTYNLLPPNLYIVNLAFQSESNLAKGRFAADLLINRKFVKNSGHMSMLISVQIDETIRFLEQTLMRMRV